MSALARITAHYLAAILEREGLSASVDVMRAEVEAAGKADEERHAGAAAAAINAWHETDVTQDPGAAVSAYRRKIAGIVEAAADETARGRQARREP